MLTSDTACNSSRGAESSTETLLTDAGLLWFAWGVSFLASCVEALEPQLVGLHLKEVESS